MCTCILIVLLGASAYVVLLHVCMSATLPIFLKTDRQVYTDIHKEIYAADIEYTCNTTFCICSYDSADSRSIPPVLSV